ncbi:class I tRNA ligase family protein [Lachnoclostridium phytofermentans]|uniref:class I tRNA ligase family protein n=1 Tax=Lachnoclostridium phytofermentans TaxID=66219 RepID=UPI00049764AC|nr:class I tRNA ligase family protein [Lachnoclostridium phytofermentans]
MSEWKKEKKRPVFPKRAVVTAGMPYGNKELHFGHVGGMFVHADTFARFLRDRIGEKNVIFVSGTDCYGSPILESYRKSKEENPDIGTITDYVRRNHEKQKEVLEKYQISPNLYAASALGEAGKLHEKVSEEVFLKLKEQGYLEKLTTTQFYDPDFNVFLNGRQVVGQCPIEGCQSEHGYADECSLGHQYMPSDLIHPKSTLSGKTPIMKEVSNWYFRLEDCTKMLQARIDWLRKNTVSRKYLLNTIEEFLKPPVMYVLKKQIGDLKELEEKLPTHETINEEKKSSITFVFRNLNDRDKAKDILAAEGLRYRSGKTLVPFRLTGNIEWGVPVPGEDDLTFWVWPESLWAPISFTKEFLKLQGKEEELWKEYFLREDSEVYQFIGEDNIYFYGIAEMAMFAVLFSEDASHIDMEKVKLPMLVANNHILFMDKKASSSSEVKPPMAGELLDYYTDEQLRIHFLSLGLANKSVSFMPQVYLPKEKQVGADPVLKDGNLLTNVFNRLVRSCFYQVQSDFDGKFPLGDVSKEVLDEAEDAILTYEEHMYRHEFHSITYVLDTYIRSMNKRFANGIKVAQEAKDKLLLKQLLIDCFHGVRTAAILLHPIAPRGCEMVQQYLKVGNEFFSWEHIFEPISYFTSSESEHELQYLEPRVDFFAKHPSQFER